MAQIMVCKYNCNQQSIAKIQADGSSINCISQPFFSFGLTVLQLKLYFKSKFHLLTYISTGRTQHQIPVLRQCWSLAARLIEALYFFLLLDLVISNWHFMKKISLLIVLIFFAFDLFAQINIGENSASNIAVQGSIGLGTIIAVVISWSRNESVLWAILHGLFGWFYVIYFVIVREQE